MSRGKVDKDIPKPEARSADEIQVGDVVTLHFLEKEEGYKGTNTTQVVERRFDVIGKYPSGVLLERNGSREFFTYWELGKRIKPPCISVTAQGQKMYRWDGDCVL